MGENGEKAVFVGFATIPDGRKTSGLDTRQSGPARADVPVKAAKPGPPETKQTTTVPGLIAEFVEALTYDLDGNLATDGRVELCMGCGESAR